MPSMNLAQIAQAQETAEECIFVANNKFLSEHPHVGYVYSAKIDTSFAGRDFDSVTTQAEALRELRTLDVILAPKAKAVIFNELAIDMSLHNHQLEQGINYFTVQEIVTGISSVSGKPITNLPDDFRLIRVMTPIIYSKGAEKFIPLTVRGEGATHEGLLGCSSKLLGQPLTPEFINAVANSELCISVNELLHGPETRKKSPQKIEIPHTVNIHGGHANGTVECFAHDNSEQRILTFVFPFAAELPDGKIAVHNVERLSDSADLVNLKNLDKNRLMPGLKEFLLDK